MDGTLAKWNNVEFEQLFEEGYYRNLEPNLALINDVKTLIASGIDVYILSAYLTESEYALDEKKEWVEYFLPELPEEHRIFVPYGTNKAEYLRNNYSPITSEDYLIDDYTQNLLEWKEYGGVGVKYLNGINHTRGTWNGLFVNREPSGLDVIEDTSLYGLVLSERLKEQGAAVSRVGLSNINYALNEGRDYLYVELLRDDTVHHITVDIDRNNRNLLDEIDAVNNSLNNERSEHPRFSASKTPYGMDFEDFYKSHYPTISKKEDFGILRDELTPKMLDDIEFTAFVFSKHPHENIWTRSSNGDIVWRLSDDQFHRVNGNIYIDWYEGALSTQDFLAKINSTRVSELIQSLRVAVPGYEETKQSKNSLTKELKIVQTFLLDYLSLLPRSVDVVNLIEFIQFAQNAPESNGQVIIDGKAHEQYVNTFDRLFHNFEKMQLISNKMSTSRLQGTKEFRYQLLDRMRSDCDYFLNNGGGASLNKYLWADNASLQVDCMRYLWNSFSEGDKPEWLTLEQIDVYETKMQEAALARETSMERFMDDLQEAFGDKDIPSSDVQKTNIVRKYFTNEKDAENFKNEVGGKVCPVDFLGGYEVRFQTTPEEVNQDLSTRSVRDRLENKRAKSQSEQSQPQIRKAGEPAPAKDNLDHIISN